MSRRLVTIWAKHSSASVRESGEFRVAVTWERGGKGGMEDGRDREGEWRTLLRIRGHSHHPAFRAAVEFGELGVDLALGG